ncbi:acetate kinase [Candidatus Poribacteria bacterium]|nr:MAG: acetate kinase [Candidatus Poribacteria bacterium]
MLILCANVGSTSFKYQIIEIETERMVAKGVVERIGNPPSLYTHVVPDKNVELKGEIDAPDHLAAVRHAVSLLTHPEHGAVRDLSEIAGVGFKTVFAKGITRSALITEEVIKAMEEYTPLVPAHNPPYIAAIRAFQKLMPGKPLVGVFETWFHETMPDYAREFGLPREWVEKYGIRRYGFHGASHRYISERVPQILGLPAEKLRIISCHLGGSSSVCAIKGGRSIDTSMGFSAQCGLLQSTRCGDLDPFIIPYIMDKEGLTTDQLREMLIKNAGLKGISGISGDMRDLMEAASKGDENAKLAIDTFHYGVKKYIGAYAAAMGGVDVIAFTGGIGEKNPPTREAVCQGLEFMGVRIDPEKNRKAVGVEAIISSDDSRVKVMVVPTNEELIVARETARVIRESGLAA